MIEIDVTGRIPDVLSEALIRKVVEAGFAQAKHRPKGSMSITFVTDARMQQLNRKYRKKNKSTDVLSFGEPEIPTVDRTGRNYGDIFVSPTYVRGEAKRRKIEFREELARVIVHGVLHLLGFDHVTHEEEIHMFTLQEHAVAKALKL